MLNKENIGCRILILVGRKKKMLKKAYAKFYMRSQANKMSSWGLEGSFSYHAVP